MAKKRTNSKKNQKRTDPTAGSKNSKSPPTSDVSRPTSRLSNPSDVENSGHKCIAVKKKDVFQKPMQVFGNRASQLNIPAKKNAEENKILQLIEQTPKTESWDNLLLKSPISSSCLDDADVHIRQVIAEFGNEMGGETARLKAIAEINYMIGSTSSFLQRFTIRNKLHSYGFFSALAAHIDSGLPSKMIAAEIETYLNSENRDARLVGLQGNDESPIEALAKLMSKVNDDQCREIVELLDFISNSNDIGGLLKNLTSHSNGSVLKESECQTDCAFMRSETKDNASKVLSTCYDIPEESAVFCDYSTSDDDTPPLNLDMLKGAAAGLRSTTGGVPPPPPLPSFPFNGSSPNAFSPGTTTSPVLSPGVVKSAVVYRKQKKTAFVRWPKLTMLMQDAGTVFNDSLCVDFNEEERSKMEEIFEEAPVKQLNRKIGGSVGRAFGKSLRATTSSSDINTVSARSPTNPQILVSPKALTIEILIKKLKPLDFTELIEKMEKNETEGIKVDLMTTLNNNFPDKDELDPFLKVEYRSLTHASDQFCWHIARNKHLRLRIELFITKENVTAEIVEFQTQIETLQAGCKMSRGEIVQILLRKCLQYGNYLNQGSMFAEASGFQFSYLIQLLQMKGKGEHMSVRLVDLIVAFCDLPTSQVEEVHSKIMAARPLNLKDLEDAVAQVQRTIRKLDGQMRNSNVETLIAAYQPFMDDTNEKLQNVLNGLSDVKNREMELQVYLCAGNMTLQAIFETLEQSTKIVSDAIKQAASKARVTRATSMVSLPTSSVPQRTLKEGEVLARKSIALKSRDLPVEELKKLFSHSSFGPQRGKRIPASPLTRTNTSPTRTIRRRSGESGRERADETTQREERSSVQTPSTPSTPIEPPSVASLRREIRDLSSLVGSPV
ncbi:hypothetical protein CAEBREN_29004 [Caenorhabditis brenneri]|uniref:FH2 domain-containing protein n=1 Tax=Caenorhabditis brenneri TaxID=135651 RepID=G0N981_CAEBE|nr:hypothetical protein CAEBREN_29004 [Caenorhabditis brenneri]